jgi:hypothetical protein
VSHLLATIIILVLTYTGLLFTQRQLRIEIQGILLILTKNRELTNTVFAILFLPGVFLHETSHYVTAKLLGVRTRRFSLIPKPLPSGNIRLGYVEIEATDIFRESLIGLAPFLSGLVVLTYIVFYQLSLGTIVIQDLLKSSGLGGYLGNFLNQPDFWIWLYLGLTISNMMFPSEADRKAWFPVILIGVILVVIGVILGLGEWFWGRFGLRVTQFLDFLEVLFGFALLINFVPMIILWPSRVFLSWITHSSVVRIDR